MRLADADMRFAEQCLGHLRALPFVRGATLVRHPHDEQVDAELTLRTIDKRETSLPCEIKRTHLRQETALHLVNLRKGRPGLLVFAPTVGRDLGDLFEKNDVNFVDAAGNCFVRIADQFVARVQGRAHEKVGVSDRGIRAAGYRALLALLVSPELLDAPSRTIAAAAEVSPQTANDVRRRLVADSVVLESGAGFRWMPGRRKDAVAMWLAGFASTLGPSLVVGRFRAQDRTPSELEARIEPILDATCEWRYGGGAAVNRLTHYYRGDRTVLYMRGAPGDVWTQLRLVRDPSGPVVLARAPGPAAFDGPDPRTVHPLLIYADLLGEGHDRAREAAARLQERYLDSFEPAA